MATATLTQNTDTVLAEIFIAAPPARVFEAITSLGWLKAFIETAETVDTRT
jgi:uncharacterized protein YndB with AHSA1/START domain